MTKRLPHPDNDLIDEAAELDTPAFSGASGGGTARSVGNKAELANADARDPEITRVRKEDKPPQPPQRKTERQ